VSRESNGASVLLHHDGELADVRTLLLEFGTEHHEQTGPATWDETAPEWDVVIATPRRILDFQPPRSGRRPMQIAISDGDSRTMRVQMQRMAVNLMVRRPVHPAALRLLLLHSLYRGPERRHRERVSIGSEVHFKTGWLARSATLAELSTRGCQILSRKKIRLHKKVRIQIPSAVTGERALRVEGTVLRCFMSGTDEAGVSRLAIRFDDVSTDRYRRLLQIVERYRKGPAALSRNAHARGSRSARDRDVKTRLTFVAEGGVRGDVDVPPEIDESLEAEDKDRRGDSRHSYERRVVALGQEATRVLLGRDLSMGGMRVDPHPNLCVGDSFRIALHAATRSEPLVLHTTVQRDGGESGLVMTFDDLDESVVADLAELLKQLPAVESEWNGEWEEGLVISEIIEDPAEG